MMNRANGFTILELLVGAGVFSIILVLLLGVVTYTSTLTSQAGDRISTFQSARTAFDIVSTKTGQATLNTYWDYDDPSQPTRYLRMSELHFRVGDAGANPFPGTEGTGQAVFFQAPLGISSRAEINDLTDLLNACGFYIQYGETDTLPPPFPTPAPRYRYQLMQALQISEDLSVYDSGDASAWINGIAARAVPIAENVIYFSVWPRRSLGDDPAGTQLTSNFSYDSRLNAENPSQPVTAHQMPPILQVTMVVLDEHSAARICLSAEPPSEIQSAFQGLFQTSDQETFERDIERLEQRLAAENLNFRIFSAMVAVRESKME